MNELTNLLNSAADKLEKEIQVKLFKAIEDVVNNASASILCAFNIVSSNSNLRKILSASSILSSNFSFCQEAKL